MGTGNSLVRNTTAQRSKLLAWEAAREPGAASLRHRVPAEFNPLWATGKGGCEGGCGGASPLRVAAIPQLNSAFRASCVPRRGLRQPLGCGAGAGAGSRAGISHRDSRARRSAGVLAAPRAAPAERSFLHNPRHGRGRESVAAPQLPAAESPVSRRRGRWASFGRTDHPPHPTPTSGLKKQQRCPPRPDRPGSRTARLSLEVRPANSALLQRPLSGYRDRASPPPARSAGPRSPESWSPRTPS